MYSICLYDPTESGTCILLMRSYIWIHMATDRPGDTIHVDFSHHKRTPQGSSFLTRSHDDDVVVVVVVDDDDDDDGDGDGDGHDHDDHDDHCCDSENYDYCYDYEP